MKGFFVVSFLVSILVFPPISADGDVRRLNDTQKEALRDFVRQVLNLDLPNPNGKTEGNASRDVGDVSKGVDIVKSNVTKGNNEKNIKFPKHMLELYEKHTFQNIAGRETIRSIDPLKDFVPHFKDVILFNVSSISGYEKVKSAYLHIHRRRLSQYRTPRKGALPPPCRVRLYQLMVTEPSTQDVAEDKQLNDIERTKLRSLDSVLVAQVTRGGWHTIDISMALKELLNSPSNGIFGVRFEGPKGKSITPQHFLKETGDNLASAFILIFSENNPQNDVLRETKFDDQKLKIISEIMDIAENTSLPKPERKIYFRDNTGARTVPQEKDNFYIYDKSQQKGRKTKKVNVFEIDPIRHERKYYRDKHYTDIDEDNNIDTNNVEKHDEIKEYNKNSITPGNGDIVELLDYDRVKKMKKMRRHNHRTINDLNLRYDTATKRIVQKKLGKYRHMRIDEDNMKNEKNPMASTGDFETNHDDNTRLRRSVDSQDVEDYGRMNDEYVLSNNDIDKPTKEKELETEDDMGDLSYNFNHDNNDIKTDFAESDNNNRYESDNTLPDATEFDYDENDNMKNYDNFDHESGVLYMKPSEKKRHKNVYKEPAGLLDNINLDKHTLHKTDLKHLKACGRSKLTLNFEDLGWSNNIIAPKTLDIGFCSGYCRSTSYNPGKMTAHAMLQRFAASLNGKEVVPEPCCVPSKVTSASFLIFHPSGNVLLHTLPNVLVEDCECR